jgi:hypothetical protein
MTKTLLALSSVALAAVLAGCGGGLGGSPTASPTANAQDQALKYVQCMRKHGIQMEDPKPGGGLAIRGGPGMESKLKAAEEACRALAPTGKGKGKMSAEDLDRMTKLAQCLRRNGLDVKDPKPGEPFQMRTRAQDAAKTEKAMKVCQKEVGLPDDAPGSGSGGSKSVSGSKG